MNSFSLFVGLHKILHNTNSQPDFSTTSGQCQGFGYDSCLSYSSYSTSHNLSKNAMPVASIYFSFHNKKKKVPHKAFLCRYERSSLCFFFSYSFTGWCSVWKSSPLAVTQIVTGMLAAMSHQCCECYSYKDCTCDMVKSFYCARLIEVACEQQGKQKCKSTDPTTCIFYAAAISSTTKKPDLHNARFLFFPLPGIKRKSTPLL